ncbi:hypothetical protein TWF481_005636 [Arthrobotrys musiformis]|uniref:Uncharacterized protein n=1 Tax=Arthrobotrys musiformis TaxID=47236 RepID=A0AAV9WG07_9PEZI
MSPNCIKSSLATIWLEQCSIEDHHAGTAVSKIPKYVKTPTYSPSSSTELSHPSTHPKQITYKTHEAFVESHPGSYYRIGIYVPRHLTNYGVQVIIDGVEQNAYVELPRWLKGSHYKISSRRTTKLTCRHYQFSTLAVTGDDDDVLGGDYDFKDSQHCKTGWVNWFHRNGRLEPTEHMIGKKAVGTIRVNFYKLESVVKLPKEEQRDVDYEDGDWEPCQAVDSIGAIKLGAGVENVTTLGPERANVPPFGLCKTTLKFFHPVETFVFKYRPRDVLMENNLLVAKRPTGLKKFTHLVKNIFTHPSKSHPPSTGTKAPENSKAELMGGLSEHVEKAL